MAPNPYADPSDPDDIYHQESPLAEVMTVEEDRIMFGNIDLFLANHRRARTWRAERYSRQTNLPD